MRRTDNLTTFICRLSWNMGTPTSWNSQGFSKLVMGLLCFYFKFCISYLCTQRWQVKGKGKGKAVLLQAWSGPEGSRKLRFPDFMTTAQYGGKVVSFTHWPSLPQEMFLVLISVRGWVDPRDIVRSEGFYVNEKFQWHKLGSNQRPSDL